jgi:hypothetical protein
MADQLTQEMGARQSPCSVGIPRHRYAKPAGSERNSYSLGWAMRIDNVLQSWEITGREMDMFV